MRKPLTLPMPRIALRRSALDAFADDVRAGLMHRGQKELPSKYLYDAVGSALFEAITALPEYGLTRAEERILRTHAADIAARLPRGTIVAELGSGSGRKTRAILEAMGGRAPTTYYPIEISASALTQCRRELADIDRVAVVGCEREYLDGLADVARMRAASKPMLVLFLGSTIGNFRPLAATRFLRDIRRSLRPGDTMLVGVDLEKPVEQLVAAYDDAAGVTAAFNRNLLVRINRELDADFVLDAFEHVARFNARTRSIEMHLRARAAQTVRVRRANLTVDIAAGETLWTESCHKYTPEKMVTMVREAGFRCDAQWIDREWPFADSMLIAE